MFVLRGLPSAVPYSPTLVLFLTTFLIFLKSGTYIWFVHIASVYDTHEIIHLNVLAALLVAVIWILILFTSIRTILLYHDLIERTVQVCTSFLAMDCILSLIFLLWLLWLSYLHLPLAVGSIGSICLILSFVLLMYWQFMVYIHILVNSLQISILRAGVYALFYQLLQHNLAEILLNILVSVN